MLGLMRKEQKAPVDESKLIPEVNIGMVGHVDHGKTTLTQALTGKWTDTHSEEIKRGITIRLGYADATFYKCQKCQGTKAYSSSPKCQSCFSEMVPLRTVSFVDAPGHATLMATVLSATSIINGAILTIAADEECPKPQTVEHLMALDIAGIKNVVIAQNKVDAVMEQEAKQSYGEIKELVKGTVAEEAPIIPISAAERVNIDALIEAIEERMPTPPLHPEAPPRMLVARSFDINKPGTEPEKLQGGVMGGSLIRGRFSVGEEIEIFPGIDMGGKVTPLRTRITGLQKASRSLEKAGPGGLLGLRTSLDPSYTKSDSLAGSVVTHAGQGPPILWEITLEAHLFEKVVGVKEKITVGEIKTNETFMISCNIAKTVGTVTSARPQRNEVEIKLKAPICAEKGERMAMARQIAGRWRLIGYGIIQ